MKKMTDIATKTIEKFLSESEIDEIENIVCSTEVEINQSGKEHGDHQADYYYIKLYDHEPHSRISEILLPKLKSLLNSKIYIDDCHIMNSFKPYIPHSDTLTPVPRDGYKHAWTIIIPLSDYYSNTFIFEEECSWSKSVMEWVKKENIKPKFAVSEHIYKTYFSHSDRKQFDYLTIHDIFPWRKGWLNATSRTRFHSSDNFLARGISSKRAIVMWTSLSKYN